MATYRPFAYNTGSTIDGTEQVGDLAIGYPTYGFESTGIRWYNGPDENLGYIIGFPQSGGTQPLPVSGTGYVQFWRSKECSVSSFVALTNSVIKNPTFNDPTTAKNYLNSLGYWTNFQTGQSLILDSGNINSYPGTGNTWFDLSINNNNGTLINGVTYSSSFGGILNFNPASSQYVSFSSPTNIPITGSQYTINTWFRPNGIGDYGLVGWGNWGSYNQVNALRLFSNGFVNYWWANDLIVPYVYNVGQWYNLSVTYDGTYRTMYVNGVQVGQDTPGIPNVSTSSNLQVGTTNGSEYFNGDIAIVDIYPFAQNICEIGYNYTSLLPRFLNLITPTPTNTITPTPSITVSKTPTQTPTNTPSVTTTNTPTNTETPTQTPTNTPSVTTTNTPTNTETPTNTPTTTSSNTPTTTNTPTNTPTVTTTNTPTNTETPTTTPTNTPTVTPSLSNPLDGAYYYISTNDYSVCYGSVPSDIIYGQNGLNVGQILYQDANATDPYTILELQTLLSTTATTFYVRAILGGDVFTVGDNGSGDAIAQSQSICVSSTPTPTPTNTPTITSSNTPTNTQTQTNTPTTTQTPTQTNVPTTPTSTPTNTTTPTITPSNTPTNTTTHTPTTTQTPTPTKLNGGSLFLVPGDPDWLSVTGSTSFAVGTGDFTVEWFQYQNNNGNENYLFSYGTTDNFAVSVASGGNRLNCYMGGSRIDNPSITNATNTWFHVAITRSAGTYNAYFNGTRVTTLSNTTNITDTTSIFYIGTKDGVNPTGDNFPGNITNFRFVKGTAVYTAATLTVPTSPLISIPGTELLLAVKTAGTLANDTSGTNKAVTNNGATFSALTPF